MFTRGFHDAGGAPLAGRTKGLRKPTSLLRTRGGEDASVHCGEDLGRQAVAPGRGWSNGGGITYSTTHGNEGLGD
jgi:hypothetical protein